MALSSTSIFSLVDDDPGGTTDTFLLAGWFLIPLFDETGPTFQGITILTASGIQFFIQFSFNSGIVTIETGINDSQFGGSVVSGGTSELPTPPPNDVYFPGGWNSFALSGQFSTQTLQWMINRTLYDPQVTWSSSGPVVLPNPTGWGIGPGLIPPGFALSDWRFSWGESFFDLTDSANTNKLFTITNHPIFWGSQGELVTGVVPKVFLHGNVATYQDNLGLLGAFGPGPTIPLEGFSPGPS